ADVSPGEDREVVGQLSKPALLPGALEMRLEFGLVHAGDRNVKTDPIDSEQTEGEEDLVAKILDLEDVQKCLKHRSVPARTVSRIASRLFRTRSYSAGPAPSS